MQRTLSHVVGLEDLALVGRSVSVHGEGRVVLVLPEVLLGERDSGSEGDLSSDDSVSTEKAVAVGRISQEAAEERDMGR